MGFLTRQHNPGKYEDARGVGKSLLILSFKLKGDVQSCSRRQIRLMSYNTKLWERVVEARLRGDMTISEQ